MATTLYEVRIGNVIGIVEEPDDIDPFLPLGEQLMVKIGAIDRLLPLQKEDTEEAILLLRWFAEQHVPES